MKNIVFDLGRVLLNFDHGISLSAFEKFGAKFDRSTFFEKFLIDKYERGDISGDEFVDLVLACCPEGVTAAAIAESWANIFSPIDEMIELAARLRRSYGVFILSNTCDLHWEFVEEAFRLSSLVHGTVTSYEARCRKPEVEIYRFAEKKLGLDPQKTVFIDDLAENAEGAVTAGWRGIHHISPQATKCALREMGFVWC